MTPYLQSGDVVFMTFPLIVRNGIPDNEKSNQAAQLWVDTFYRHGVTVASWVTTSATPGPTVFAVFRNPKGADA